MNNMEMDCIENSHEIASLKKIVKQLQSDVNFFIDSTREYRLENEALRNALEFIENDISRIINKHGRQITNLENIL